MFLLNINTAKSGSIKGHVVWLAIKLLINIEIINLTYFGSLCSGTRLMYHWKNTSHSLVHSQC